MSAVEDRPISEVFRLVALKYVDAAAASRLYEETKSSFRARLIADTEGKSMAEREMKALASPEYDEFIRGMCAAADEALKLKLQMELIRMRFAERQSEEASARKEMSITR